MSSGSPSPFARAQLWSADQWASVSLTGARPGASPSPMNSSLDVTTSSLPVQRPPLVYPISLANKQNPPPATSILDSPLARNVSLAPRLISDPFPRHSRYYLLDQMAVIMVEGCLFRVHRYFMDRESQVFPKGTSSDATPILLPEVTRQEFESLLDFLYDSGREEYKPTLDAWVSLLSVSTRFEMSRVRSRSIAEIFKFWDQIDPVNQVTMAVKHHVPEWLPLGYAALCRRLEPIEVEEGIKLGLETTVKLAKAREGIREASSRAMDRKASSHSFDNDLITMIVDDIFWPTPVSPVSEMATVKIPAVTSTTPFTPPTIPIDSFAEVSPPGSPQIHLPDSSPESHGCQDTLELHDQPLSPLGSPEHREIILPERPAHGFLNPLASTFELARASVNEGNSGEITPYEGKEKTIFRGAGKKGKKWKGKKPSLSVAAPLAALAPHLQVGEP